MKALAFCFAPSRLRGRFFCHRFHGFAAIMSDFVSSVAIGANGGEKLRAKNLNDARKFLLTPIPPSVQNTLL